MFVLAVGEPVFTSSEAWDANRFFRFYVGFDILLFLQELAENFVPMPFNPTIIFVLLQQILLGKLLIYFFHH